MDILSPRRSAKSSVGDPTRNLSVGSWINARRLIAHGTTLALCLWLAYAWNVWTPGLRDRAGNLKGTDFLHFYTLGALASAHDGVDLYDMNAQAVVAARLVPQAAGIRYLPLYPPQVSILLAPFAHLSYGWALAAWWSWSTAIYSACCYAIWRVCPALRAHGRLVAILAIGFPAFFHLIAWGQTSALALTCFTAIYFSLRSQRDFLAGLALGCLIFKPQLALAAAIVFACLGMWKLLGGAAIAAAVELWAGVLYYGIVPLQRWIAALKNVPSTLPFLEPRLYQTHSLRAFWSLLLPWSMASVTLYFLSAVIALVFTIAFWKPQPAPEFLPLRFSVLLFATVLVAPHLTVYDLVILAPAFLLVADWLAAHPISDSTLPSAGWLAIFLYFAYILPLVGPFARWTHVQLSVIAMAGCVYFIWKMGCETLSAQDSLIMKATE